MARSRDTRLPAVEAAILLRISRERVIRLVQRGKLAGERHPSRGWLVSRRSAEEFARGRPAEGGTVTAS